jgi:flagellin-specific chaperone FliS
MKVIDVLKNVKDYANNHKYDLVENNISALYDYVELKAINEEVDFEKVEEIRELNNMLQSYHKLALMNTKRSFDYIEAASKLFDLFNNAVDELIG